MSKLFEMPLVLGTLCFVAGYALAKLGAVFGRKTPETRDSTERDRRLRSLDAELRVAQKKLQEAETGIAARDRTVGELRAELDALRDETTTFEQRTEDLRSQLHDECEKTQRLRTELRERAEHSIRTEVQLRDVQTELSLAQAGSDAVHDEIERLAAEREELTNRLKALQQQAEAAETQGNRSAAGNGDLALDC